MMTNIKKCSKCHMEKLLCEFDKCSKTKCGHRSVCKFCRKNERIEKQDLIKVTKKKYYEKNKEKVLELAKEYKEKNKQKILENAKKYREQNKEKVHLSKKKSTLKRYKTDGMFRLTNQLRKYVKRYFNQTDKSRKTYEIVGCTPKYLKEFIEKKFDTWMTWDNYGYGEGKWVIDHIKPLSSAKTKDELYTLCHYSNLQPLSWRDNMVKSNKII